MAPSVRHLGLLTSGGDAPGMNAALRAVARSALDRRMRVTGFLRGYWGLIDNDAMPMTSLTVGGIINRGGTILRTVRCPEFKREAVRRRAYRTLEKHGIDGLAVLGGNGSAKGAYAVHRETRLPVVVVPASIDNDIFGTDETIGFDSAVNTAVEAIDKIRDTATSHERIFVIQVMGRENGFIAQEVGLCCGAEAVLVPEVSYNLAAICRGLMNGHKRGKLSSIIVMAEGAGDSRRVAAAIKQHTHLRVRVSVLGYIQRGGNPSARSRYLAARLGNLAVIGLRQGRAASLAAVQKGVFLHFPLHAAVQRTKRIDRVSYKLAYQLAR